MSTVEGNSQVFTNARQSRSNDDWLFEESSDEDEFEELFADVLRKQEEARQKAAEEARRTAEEARRQEEEQRRYEEEQRQWAQFRIEYLKVLEEGKELRERMDQIEAAAEEARRGPKWTEEDDIEAGTRAGIIAVYKRHIRPIKSAFDSLNRDLMISFFAPNPERVITLLERWRREIKEDEKRAADAETWAILGDEVQKFSQLRVSIGQRF